MERPVILYLVLMAVAIALVIAPKLSRPSIFFGVTVSPAFRGTGQGRAITLRYQLILAAAAAAAFGLMALSAVPMVVPVWVLVLAGVVAWAMANRMVQPHAVAASTERSAVIDEPTGAPQTGWLRRLGPYAILSAAALYVLYDYGLLPDPLPVHWSGPEPDGFQPKTWLTAFRPLIIGTSVCLLMEITKASLASRSLTRRLTSTSGDDRESRFFRLNLWMLLATQYWTAMLFAWLAIVVRGSAAQEWLPPGWGFYGALFLAFAPIPLLIYIQMRYGQGGTRLPSETLSISSASDDRTPDDCWKLGQFYFNPNDAAIWVEKRAGVGYTLNFARLWSWVWLVGMIGVPLMLARFLR